MGDDSTAVGDELLGVSLSFFCGAGLLNCLYSVMPAGAMAEGFPCTCVVFSFFFVVVFYGGVATTMIFPKRIFATNRAAIGRIRTILRGSKAGPRGHILGPFPAPGGPKNIPKKNQKLFGKIIVFATPLLAYQEVVAYTLALARASEPNFTNV